MSRLRAAVSPAHLALALIVVLGLGVRVLHNTYGLPYVYNVDEGSHFTSRAVAMFGNGPNPHYFQNPSAFTYLDHLALRFQYGIGHVIPFGHYDEVIKQYSHDPTQIYRTGRTLAAVLCILGVLAVFWVGRRLWGVFEGVAAAGVLSFAFLPVAYSRIAVTDVGTLLPVAFTLYAAVRVYEDGMRRHWLLGGAMAGLAIGFKYTAGLALLPLLLATLARIRVDRSAIREGLFALAAAFGVFFVTNPYVLIDFSVAWHQLKGEQQLAGDIKKLGQEQYSGPGYYLQSLTWGLGWAPGVAMVAGLALEARRRAFRALLLAAFPVALFLYLSFQSRYFGRWLLPAYPALALLAGAAIAYVARLAPRGPALKAAALALILVGVLALPIAADVHTARMLGRTDTRQLAREFLINRYPTRLRIVIEPMVPPRYYRVQRPGLRTSLSRKQFVRGFIKDVTGEHVDYGTTLHPGTIDRYRRAGFCLVMTGSVIRGRSENAHLAPALAYYRRLERESDLVYHISPYKAGAKPVKFNFDLSYNYYPSTFEKPGPEIWIYRLRKCKQGYGAVPKGIGTAAVRSAPGARE